MIIVKTQPTVSARLKKMPASPIRKLVPYAVEAKKQGVHVFHLNIGDPDILTPQVMLDVLTGWKRNPIGYEQSQGQPQFIHAVLSYYHKLGYTFIKPADIQISTGGSEAISMALFAVTDPGDEVIVFEPFYANYNSYAVGTDIRLRAITTTSKNGFHLPTRKAIENQITKRTKAILICNPNNPTGTVYTKKEIEMLIEIVKKHNLFLLSDEVYREFAYDNRAQVSLLRYMQEIPEKAVVLDSLSKRYSLCGARLGMLISLNKNVMDGVLRIAQGRLSSGLVDQTMASQLTRVPQSYFDAVKTEYEKRRDVLYDALSKIPGVFIPKPEGAFYSIVKLPVDDAEKFCQWLLTDFRYNNKTVMIAPAQGFYATPGLGKDEVRIAYVLNIKDLLQSITILQKALQEYSK